MKHRKPAPTWHRLGLKISKKVVVGITAAATAFGGLAIASTAAQASTDRDSYADTVENTTFEQAQALRTSAANERGRHPACMGVELQNH